ncbi:MAG: ATP-binding cassette domain-containing protein [Anaerolineae bacterium]|nr:ATP-binding cassette domain-containing protein [Anaerolineae bacterium]
MLELHDLTFAYRESTSRRERTPRRERIPGWNSTSYQPPVFAAFSWRAKRGEVWSVLGPSGCGKSTLLMLLAGLLQPQRGSVFIDGENIVRPRPRTGLILQEYGLLPWATVRENVALGLKIRRFYGPDGRHVPYDEQTHHKKVHPEAYAYLVDHWLARLGIDGIADAYPGQISGGQRQRTAIARTLVLAPDLLLMDEPFSALDAPTREGLQSLTLELCAEAGLTVVLVTHNIEEAAFMGQHILLLSHPPNQNPIILHNIHPNTRAYRNSPAYQATLSRLRATL